MAPGNVFSFHKMFCAKVLLFFPETQFSRVFGNLLLFQMLINYLEFSVISDATVMVSDVSAPRINLNDFRMIRST